MHRDCGSRRTVISEELAIYFVVTREIVHVYEVGRKLDDITKLRSRARKNVTNVFNHGARLLANVEPRCSERIEFCPSNRIVNAAGTGTRHKKEITRPLEMWIFPTRDGFSLYDFALTRAHIYSSVASQLDADIIQLRIEIQGMNSALPANARESHAAERSS
jgi:hypothetical protein